MRWGLGPVFAYECLIISRRWQTYALRSAGVAALLFAMTLIATSSRPTWRNTWQDYAELGQAYFVAMIGVELALVMLAAPAATAGAICLDRARGTLAHTLMTDLSDAEIVLGKLAARLLPVFALVACSWPVMAISALLGGIDPVALTLAFAIILTVAVFGCTLALALSVWARKSHEVILATYTVFVIALLIWPVWALVTAGWTPSPPPTWTLLADPFYLAFAPYTDPGKVGFWEYFVFFSVALGAASAFTLLAVWRTRPVACRGSAETSKEERHDLTGRLRRWLPGPSLDRNPVLWREWHRSRPSRWMRVILLLLMGSTFVFCVTGAVASWRYGAAMGPSDFWRTAGVFAYMLHIIFGLLLLAVIAPTSMAEERQRGTLDVLAATALSTRAIVIGKWLGTFRLVFFMTVGPGLIALAMATARWESQLPAGSGLPPEYYQVIPFGSRCFGVFMVVATILAHGALITSIGLALAVWIHRQSRAIAMSIGFFILITAVWPIIVTIVVRSAPRFVQDIVSLSPVVTSGLFVNFFTSRVYAYTGNILPAVAFWAAEVSTLAAGLLWLTVRTFDDCSDRIPDRPHRLSLLTTVVMILAAMVAAGCLVGAVASWIGGIKMEWSSDPPLVFRVLCFSLALTVGLVLIAVKVATAGGPERTTAPEAAPDRSPRQLLLDRWRRSFRLVLLLASGPAILSLALATAYKAPRYEPQFTMTAPGVQTMTSYVLVNESGLFPGELGLGMRLLIAAVLVVTILVHGGAAISVGLGLTTASTWSRRTIAAAVGLTVLVMILVPLHLFLAAGIHEVSAAMWSFVMASSSLLTMLATHRSLSAGDVISSVVTWDLLLALVALGLVRWTVLYWESKMQGLTKPSAVLASDRVAG